MDILKFKSIYLKTYITAVKFYRDDFIFAAAGGNLSIYELKGQTITKLNVRIFESQTIHGIVFNEENECLVYGGKEVCVLKLSANGDAFDVRYTYQMEDWILQSTFFQNYVFSVTAHNVAMLHDKITGTEKHRYNCDEKCILYGAELVINEYGDSTKNIVLGGTVFSEIIIWMTCYSEMNNKVLHRLQGHKGVIFSIAFNNKLRKITTTSDDRSLRIWNIKDNKVSESNIIEWENVNITLLHTAFGHMDRVRCSIILEELNIVISIGEDSMICTWDMNGVLISKKSSHQKGPIWAFDVNIKNQLIVTGGSDGGILLHKLLSLSREPLPLSIDIPGLVKAELVTPRKILYTSMNNLLCVLYNGDLIKYNQYKKSWCIIDKMIEMVSYCIINSKFDKVLVCGLDGNVRLYKEKDNELILITKQCLFSNRIVAGALINCNSFVVCTEQGKLYCYIVNDTEVLKCNEFEIPRSSEPWFTAADQCKIGSHLVIGDRKGNIHLFENNCLEPVCTIYKAHCHLGVTSLFFQDNVVTSTGRDGKCLKFIMVDNKLLKLSCTKLDMKWIEKYITLNGIELLCGFTSSKFIIYTQNEVIWQVNCGGGHRSWDLSISNDLIKFSFIKNNIVHEMDCKLSDILKPYVEDSFLVKEINTLTSLTPANTKNSIFITGGEDTVLTINYFKESECKCIKLSTIQTHLSSIKDIQVLELSRSHTFISYISISSGGRAQICVSKIEVDFSTSNPFARTEPLANHMLNGSDLDRKYKNNLDIGQDTRYMSLSVIKNLLNSYSSEEDLNILVATGCSDGFLRIFSMKSLNSHLKINLIAQGENEKCILHVHSHIIKSHQNHQIIFTMDTLGILKVWDVTALYNDYMKSIPNNIKHIHPKMKWKVHGNGINSYDIITLNDDLVLMATGGDDNAIKLMLFKSTDDKIEGSFNFTKISSWSNSTTHCAQVSGILFYDELLFTTSIDQRISIFQWKISEDHKINCKYIKQYCTTIADIQGIRIINKTSLRILISVYGRGVEILEFIK